MTDDPFEAVFLPIVRELRDFLDEVVVIGGWVPELHRRFGDPHEWSVKPLGTTEVDILVDELKVDASRGTLAGALASAGFAPVGEGPLSAVWERDAAAGERVEFFVEHAGPWGSLGTVQKLPAEANLGGVALKDLGVLGAHSVSLMVPLEDAGERTLLAPVRVPELGAFLIHKGATFHRRTELERKAKDLHYIVDVMQSGDDRVALIEAQVAGYCGAGGASAELARQARNNVGVVVSGDARTALRQRLAHGLAVRHGTTEAEGDARAMGFLSDFLELIPAHCG